MDERVGRRRREGEGMSGEVRGSEEKGWREIRKKCVDEKERKGKE